MESGVRQKKNPRLGIRCLLLQTCNFGSPFVGAVDQVLPGLMAENDWATPVHPVDPLIYRFYEIMQVYGMPMKDVIQEKFGDGIMSAIDFTLDVDKVEDPKGDRVKITMCGKFLPYKKW